MVLKTDVIIAGGGIAGLTSAIHLSKFGFRVTIIEKNPYPGHKVCGEYVSNEVLPYLDSLQANPTILKPSKLSRFLITTVSGKKIETDLSMGGFGISRYAFDAFLMSKALENGCILLQGTISDISFDQEIFQVHTAGNKKVEAKWVLGGFGKRSSLDAKMGRSFFYKKSPWLAVKAHYSGEFPDDLVALHNFSGGYCGVSKVENDILNFCYIVDYENFKQYKNLLSFQEAVMFKNPYLKEIFQNSKILFNQPLTISQISFEKKDSVLNHVLMIGDSAGLIHPLCGNGMAIAIHAAKIASELIINFHSNSSKLRTEIEAEYSKIWSQNFGRRIWAGRLLSNMLRNETLSDNLFNGLSIFPFMLPQIIKQTHGAFLGVAK